MERDIQTILSNVSATLHGQDFLRADVWHHALSHWTRLHNALPHFITKSTPARIIDHSFNVDAHHQYRFAFGDLLCFPLQDHERTWKFDVKNDIGFYVGDEDSTKGGFLIYMPYTHKILTRGGGHRILISDVQLLQWYARRREITRNPLPYSIVKDAVMDLLASRDTAVIMSDNTQLLITPASDRGRQYHCPPAHTSGHPTRHFRLTHTSNFANETEDSTNTHTSDCSITPYKTRPQPNHFLQTTRHTRGHSSTPHNHCPRKPPTSYLSHR